MPVTRKITGRRGSQFWASIDLEDGQLLQAIIKEEFQRSEPADEIHYIPNCADDMPPETLYMQVSLPCLRDCLVFLYRGAILLREGAITQTGHAYAVENEEWLSLSKDTTVVVMEEGATKGICKRKTDEEQRVNRAREETWKARVTLEQSAYQARREAIEVKRNKPWNKLLRKFRQEPEPEKVQCATQ